MKFFAAVCLADVQIRISSRRVKFLCLNKKKDQQMNNHERGDFLENKCREWIEREYGPGKIIESKHNSIHGIDFIFESFKGFIFIVEVKSETGNLKNGQLSPEWIRNRLDKQNNILAKNRIIWAFKNNRPVICKAVSVKDNGNGSFEFKNIKGTGNLVWDELYPGKPIP